MVLCDTCIQECRSEAQILQDVIIRTIVRSESLRFEDFAPGTIMRILVDTWVAQIEYANEGLEAAVSALENVTEGLGALAGSFQPLPIPDQSVATAREEAANIGRAMGAELRRRLGEVGRTRRMMHVQQLSDEALDKIKVKPLPEWCIPGALVRWLSAKVTLRVLDVTDQWIHLHGPGQNGYRWNRQEGLRFEDYFQPTSARTRYEIVSEDSELDLLPE